MKTLILTILLVCLVSISCTDKDSKIEDYLRNEPVNWLDFGLYRLSEEFEEVEVFSDDRKYILDGYADARSKGIKLDFNNLSPHLKGNKPKNESKAKLLCMDTINTIRLTLGTYKGKPFKWKGYSYMGGYFSLKGGKAKELDKSTLLWVFIVYGGSEKFSSGEKSVHCVAPLLGTNIEFLER